MAFRSTKYMIVMLELEEGGLEHFSILLNRDSEGFPNACQ